MKTKVEFIVTPNAATETYVVQVTIYNSMVLGFISYEDMSDTWTGVVVNYEGDAKMVDGKDCDEIKEAVRAIYKD